MVAISDALDTQLVLLVGGLITLVGIANAILLKKLNIKTEQVNNAVNHVEPGKKPLTQRVDRIEETLHTIQYDMDVAKQTAMDVSEKTVDNADRIEETKGMVESLLKSHVETKDKLEEILLVIPKRKTDLNESET